MSTTRRSQTTLGKQAATLGNLNELPKLESFPHKQLPLLSEVIGLVMRKKDSGITYTQAENQTATEVMHHWTQRNVYTIGERHISERIHKNAKEYRDLLQFPQSRRKQPSYINRCKNFNSAAGQLFDIFCKDPLRVAKLEEQYRMKMHSDDIEFYEAMKSDRIGYCGDVDQRWHKLKEEKDVLLAKKRERETLSTSSVSYADSTDIDDFSSQTQTPQRSQSRKRLLVADTCSVKSSTPYSAATPLRQCTTFPKVHVRDSEYKVNDAIYNVCAELDGHGFSYREMQVALKAVANGLFGQQWEITDEHDRISKYAGQVDQSAECDSDSDVKDAAKDAPSDSDGEDAAKDAPSERLDLLPYRSTIRKNLKKIHAYSLKLIGDTIISAKYDDDSVLTHATDSTTRKRIGTFAPSGIHINRKYLPLPTIELASETTINIAEGIKHTLDIVGAASQHTSDELYSGVDLHMSDSTAHNINVPERVAEITNRSDVAGKLYDPVHTVLAWDNDFRKVIHEVETAMDIDKVSQGFLVGISIEKEVGTVSFDFLSWLLSLFGQEKLQKPWNCHTHFVAWMKARGKKIYMFALKDARFACLPRCCAMALYHWDDFEDFLAENLDIDNKLACLIRDGFATLPYSRIVYATVATFGVHLSSPYYMKTMGNWSISEMQDFFTTIFHKLKNHEIGEEFFELTNPHFPSVLSSTFFQHMKNQHYFNNSVISAVQQAYIDHPDECILLANKLRPRIANTLERQRGAAFGFGEPADPKLYVFNQAKNVDKAPSHNIELERQCGDQDHRQSKKPCLTATSRGNILKHTTKMRNQQTDPGAFREFGDVVRIIDALELQWSEKQENLRAEGLKKKEQQSLRLEEARMKTLSILRAAGGPFVTSAEVLEYTADETAIQLEKQKRLANEVKYHRDTSRSLPRSHPLFRMMAVCPQTKKRSKMSVHELEANLVKYLNLASRGSTVANIDTFEMAVRKLV